MRRRLSAKRVREIAAGYSATRDIETVQIAEEVAQHRNLNKQIAEALVRALYLYPHCRVDSRGPSGIIVDVLRMIAPKIALALITPTSFEDVTADAPTVSPVADRPRTKLSLVP